MFYKKLLQSKLAKPQIDRFFKTGIVALFLGILPSVALSESFKLELDSELGRLLTNLPENGWVQLNINEFSDVWTPLDQRPKPPTPSVGGPWAIIEAWSSMAWDSKRGSLIFWGGGHANYPGNEIYRWSASTLGWERASLPSEVINVGSFNNYFEAIDGIDNAPIAAHTYDNSEYLPIVDRFVTFGGATFNTGRYFEDVDGRRAGPYFWDPSRASANAVGGTQGSQVNPGIFSSITAGNMWENRDNLEPEFSDDHKPGYGGTNWIDGTTAYAEEDGKDVLYIGVGSTLTKYTVHDLSDASKDTYELVGRYIKFPFSFQGAGAFDPIRKVYLRTAGSTFTFWTLENPSRNNENVIFVPQVTTGEFPFSELKNFGLDFDRLRNRYLLWDGKSEVWQLTAPVDLINGQWQLTPLTPILDNAPNASAGTGILGKWKYIKELDVFLGAVNKDSGEIWAYKPVDWSPDIAPLNKEPIPVIRANNQSGTDIEFQSGNTLSLTVTLSPGQQIGSPADYWVKAETPFGDYWLNSELQFVRSDTPVPAYDGALIKLSDMIIFEHLVSTLPPGNYTITFAVDNNQDKNYDRTYYSSVSFTILP